MAKFPTYEQMAKKVAEKALDEFLYNGKSIREWIQIIASEDCISRQAVIKLAYDMSEIDGEHYTETCMVVDVENIQKLPPVNPQEPKTGWISVRDNLPIVGENVLICDLDGDMYISYLHTDGKWGYEECGNKIKNIIAWQPLPKPYKESEE